MTQIEIAKNRPVLIAGPTASGKSALALKIATEQGGVVINADALQVYAGWRILTARPNDAEIAQAQHALYGTIPAHQPYSVGDWLRDVQPLLNDQRPIIVGGTGLYFTALTEGLAQIPPISTETRAQADDLSNDQMLSDLDAKTLGRIDIQNRARVQRAWEVQQETGRSITDWQSETPPPLLAPQEVTTLLLDAPKEWLSPRIKTRFHNMMDNGAEEEALQMLPTWDPLAPSSKAIGAHELIAYVSGHMARADAIEASIIATRQYAKRQRTWFRKRMRDWETVHMPSTDLSTCLTFVN